MNKKLNTVLYVLIGTAVNLLLALVCIGILLYIVYLFSSTLGNNLVYFIPVALILGFGIAMFIYNRLSRAIIVKFNLTDKLAPIFASKKYKRPR